MVLEPYIYPSRVHVVQQHHGSPGISAALTGLGAKAAKVRFQQLREQQLEGLAVHCCFPLLFAVRDEGNEAATSQIRWW